MLTMLLKELRATNSNPEKVEILKRYGRHCPGLSQMLYYSYNPYFNYGIKLDAPTNVTDRNKLHEDEINFLNRCIHKKYTGKTIEAKMSLIVADRSNLVELIVSKDWRCGISATTINKAFPGLVPQFKIQLAKEVPLSEVDFPYYVETKFDGVRLVVIVRDNEVFIKTRSGKEVNLPVLNKLFSNISTTGVFDGELIEGFGKVTDRVNISGKVNSAMHGGTVIEDNFKFKVFDYLFLDEMDNGKCTRPFKERRLKLEDIMKNISGPYIDITYCYIANNIETVNELYSNIIKSGFEGLILKKPAGKYSFYRTKAWIKLKEIKTADLTCIGWEPGTGMYADAIGALVCVGKVDNKPVKVKVSGLSAKERYADVNSYLNKTIEVKYNSVIANKSNDLYSLFLPRFSSVRIDK